MKKRETLTTKKMSNLLIGLLLMTVINVFTDQGSIVAQTIENPGFETGDLTGWVPGNADKAEIIEEFVFVGTYSCVIKGPQWIETTVTGLTENTTYDVSIMHRLKEAGDGDRASSLFYRDANNDPQEIVKGDATIEYQKLSGQFTTGSGQTSITIGVENNDWYWAYFDDLIVTEAGATEEYSLTITAENGSVTTDPDQLTYASGTIVSLTATAAEGFEFRGWSGDATSTDNPLSVTMDAEKNITATFTEISSDAIVIENPGFETGDFTGWVPGNADKAEIIEEFVFAGTYSCVVKGPQWIETTVTGLTENTTYDVSIMHRLKEAGDGDRASSLFYRDANNDPQEIVKGDATIEYQKLSGQFTTGSGQTSITIGVENNDFYWAYFDDLIVTEAGATEEYSLTITAENGSVTADPDQVTYASGTIVSLTATADEGFEFTEWSGDAMGTENPLSVTMDAEKNITAIFTEIISDAIVIENPGFETGDLTGWVLSNADKTSINDSLGVVSEGMYSCLLKGPNSIKTTVTGLAENTSYIVSMKHRLEELGDEDRTQSLFYIDDNSDPVIVVTQIADTVYQQLSYQLTTAAGQTSIEIGVQNDGFFWGYFDNLIVTEAGPAIDVTGVTLDQETASVEVSNTLQLAATVSPEDATDPSVTWSTDDAAIATVDENGLVTGVSEGVTSITVTTNDQGFETSCEITVTAAPTSILTIKIVGNGSVTVEGNEYTEPVTVSLDQVVSISATADDGNEFIEWSGDESGTDNPFSITMDADKSITATFDVVQSINYSSNKAVIFPNPVENSLYIESKSAIQKITLVNSIGEKVESINLTGEYYVNLPVSNLKSGLYILILEDIKGNESFEKVFKK